MFAGNLLPIIFFLVLMLAGLMLAGWAAQLQAAQYQALSQLALLDQRRQSVQEVGRALQSMDVDTDILSTMYGTMIEDLKQMQALDPVRNDLNRHIQEAEAAMRPRSNPASGGSAAVATEQELLVAQRHIQKALQMFADLYRHDKISAGQFENTKNKLRLLGVRVSVNSCFLMAQKAMEQEDTIRAMSLFRRAESLLSVRGIPAPEKQEKLAYIKAERQRVFDESQVSAGLLLLAKTD
ncbi:MAG: hypothetical protein Q7L07_14185 [Pseudohongiella sp.]|nr:hypothetical protein [Pseudohongiella sp.]MDP1756694.1 hypothetical protein [Pseudohongiella sp.]